MILEPMGCSILDLLSEGEAGFYSKSTSGVKLTAREKNRLHFIRTGGLDRMLKTQKKAREEKL